MSTALISSLSIEFDMSLSKSLKARVSANVELQCCSSYKQHMQYSKRLHRVILHAHNAHMSGFNQRRKQISRMNHAD
jgi:hypothetical protein